MYQKCKTALHLCLRKTNKVIARGLDQFYPIHNKKLNKKTLDDLW